MKNINNMSLPSRVFHKGFVSDSGFNQKDRLRPSLLRKIALSIVGLLFGQMVQAATCQYEVVDDWNSGFKAEISIINDSAETINGWELSWSWSDGSTFSSGWQATYNCSGSSCVASTPPWNPAIAPNQTYVMGFIANKAVNNTPAESPITIEGDICNNNTPLPSVLWRLDGNNSSVQYVSMKNNSVAEVNSFSANLGESSALNGTIDVLGDAVLSIDLNDVKTGIDIRNERMINFVFETEFLPTAYIHVNLDTDALASMAVGSSFVDNVQGELSLHGISQTVSAEVLIVKASEGDVYVSTLQPINIDSKDFDMASGLEVLRGIANLTSINQSVPVYFRLHYVANTDPNVLPLSTPLTPLSPSSLAGSYDEASTEAELTWQDNSNNEEVYVVRRRSSTGLWQTVANLLSNATSYSEGLPDTGEFDYKVIAVNESVPSEPSNTVTVEVTLDNPVASGKDIYDQQCAACHGPSGGGIGNFPAINTPRDVDAMIELIAANMPLTDPGACDQQCAEIVVEYIQTLWVDEISCDRGVAPVSYGARQLKILTQSEYQRSVEDLLGVDFNAADGLSADEKVGFFFNNTHASVLASSYSNYLIVAEEIANWAADRDFSPALNCTTPNQDCADSFVDDLAPKIFRRPLDPDEVSAYAQMANGSLTSGDVSEGIKMALEAILSSPQFLYRHELGEPNPSNNDIDGDAFELTSYEMATFLAYTFTGSTPDDVLLTAAANDQLRTEAEIMNQAVRLAGAEGSKQVMGDFVGSWLGTANLDIAAKDENVWPDFLSLVPHMQNEIRETFANIMLDENESFASLYTANYTYVNQVLAEHYGISGVVGDEMQQVPTTDRGGILANGAFMARWGEAVETSPILRSVRVRRRMLCQDQPDPPAGTFEAREQKLAELSDLLQDPTTTNRLKYHRLTEDEPCTNCHLHYINPLGFGMEDFDTVGNVRSVDLNGNVIDAIGELFAPNDYNNVSEVEPFDGTRGLGALIATLPSAQACLPKQMFRYVMGVGYQEIDPDNPEGAEMSDEEKTGYACEIENLTQSMMSDSPRSMLESFSVLQAVRYRKAWSRDQ